MNNYIPIPESTDRYDDGVTLDHAAMIRMWSAFDRSLSTFNRRRGVVAAPRSSTGARTVKSENESGKR